MHCTPLVQDLQRHARHTCAALARAPHPARAYGMCLACGRPTRLAPHGQMHINAATLLNLVQLPLAVASLPTGSIATLGRAPSAPIALHGRKLHQVSVSSAAELTAAVGDSAIDKILVAAGKPFKGTYDFTSDMCSGSAICIDRSLTIEAQVPGSVVLDAIKGGRRVFNIQSSGTAELIGLNITGGSADAVQSVCLLNLLPRHFLHRPTELTLELTDCCALARDFGPRSLCVFAF